MIFFIHFFYSIFNQSLERSSRFGIALILLLFSVSALAYESNLEHTSQILLFADPSKKVTDLDSSTLSFIDKTLHDSKMASNLACDYKARIISEERRFSTGVERVEMLEIIFISRYGHVHEEKTYFPIGSKVTRRQTNSKFAGTVEEIELESTDSHNSRFIFQHNGRGEIIWMSYEDDLETTPCRLQ